MFVVGHFGYKIVDMNVYFNANLSYFLAVLIACKYYCGVMIKSYVIMRALEKKKVLSIFETATQHHRFALHIGC